jgi:hypothetical protein
LEQKKGKEQIMKNIHITYNSFVTLTDVKMDGKVLKPHTRESEFLKQRRQVAVFDWLGDFLNLLSSAYRTEICVSFTGTKDDCETFNAVVDEIIRSSTTGKVTKGKVEATLPDPLKMLDEIYMRGKQECPSPEIFNDPITVEAYKRATTREFEVNVIAPVSAVKSTLLNAMLGRNLLPTSNEACTATIMRITDEDSMKDKPFVAVRYNVKGERMDAAPLEIAKGDLKKWNNDKGIPRIEIFGDIPTISETKSAQYVFIDTPGPNNGDDRSHGEMTKEAIDKPLSMVLYVMTTKYQVGDSHFTFDMVCDAIRRSDDVSRNRFIFVLNRMDEVNTEDDEDQDCEEDLLTKTRETYDKVCAWLSSKGIANPLVIPVCAKEARAIRLHRGEANRARDFSDPQRNMYEICKHRLSPSVRKTYEKRLEAAKDDQEELALLHTGIPLLETILQEYLYRYALPTKVGDALKTFQRVFAEADKAAELRDILSKKKPELKKFAADLKKYSLTEDDLEEGEKIIQTIASTQFTISPDSEIKKELDELSKEREKTVREVVEVLGTKKLGLVEADRKVKLAKDTLDVLVSNIKDRLTEAHAQVQRTSIEELVDKYNNQLEKHLGKLSPAIRTFQTNFLSIKPDEILQRAKYSKKAQIKHPHYERHWYTLWLVEHDESTYEDGVDMAKFTESMYQELAGYGILAVENFRKQAADTFNANRDLVVGQMGSLQSKLEETKKLIIKAAEDETQCRKDCEKLESDLAWYESFQQELDGILK